jgi:hypothetical protein
MNSNEEQFSIQRRKGKRRKRHKQKRQQDEDSRQTEKEIITMELGDYPTEILTPVTTLATSMINLTTTAQQQELHYDTTIYSNSNYTDHPKMDRLLVSYSNYHEEAQIHKTNAKGDLPTKYHGGEEEDDIPIPFDHGSEHDFYADDDKIQRRKSERFLSLKTVAILLTLLIVATSAIVWIFRQKSAKIESSKNKDWINNMTCTLVRELLIECPTGYLEIPICAQQTFQQLRNEYLPQSVQYSSHAYPCNAQYYGLVATAIAKVHMADSIHEKLNENDVSEMILQYWILATFYFAMGGEAWQLSYNWLTGISPCDENWYGLSCNHTTSFVVSIEMSANQLLGAFPTEIMGLTSLQVLHLTGNDISGTISTEIGMMHNLVDLNLADTNLAGTIPTEIGLCSKLLSLNFLGTALMGSIPTEMGHLSVLGKIFMIKEKVNMQHYCFHKLTCSISPCHPFFTLFTFIHTPYLFRLSGTF